MLLLSAKYSREIVWWEDTTRKTFWKPERWGPPRLAKNRRWRAREGPEPACVRAPLSFGVGTRRREGRINVLPWYRPVGVVSTSSQTHKEGRSGCPLKSVCGYHVVRGRQSSPTPVSTNNQPLLARRRLCARVTGKAGENGQYSAAGLRAHPGQDRQLPDVVTRPRPQQASAWSKVGTRSTWLWGRYRLGHRPVALFGWPEAKRRPNVPSNPT